MGLVLKQDGSTQMTVSGDGPVRFYIVNDFAGNMVQVADFVEQSPFAMVNKDWREALPEMARKYPGRADSLEINSHGDAGMLYLQPVVQPAGLPSFAAAARGLLVPCGTIELLACRVANYNVASLIEQWKGAPDRKADVDFLRTWLKGTGGDSNEDGRVKEGAAHNYEFYTKYWEEGFKAGQAHNLKCPYATSTMQGKFWQEGAEAGANPGLPGSRGLRLERREPPPKLTDMDHTRVARLAIESGINDFGDSFNGPLFCSKLARLFSCKVRAGMSTQWGEMASGMSLDQFLRTNNYKVQSGTSWTGHVFDFSPGGSVTYVGYNVSRPVYVPITPGGDGPARQI
jgi:hypothetical protein